jgi:hypothetical protein
VLLGKLPAWSAALECRDDRLYLGIVQPVSKPSLPEAGSYGTDAPCCEWLTAFKRLVKLQCQLFQVMQEVATVQVGVEEADTVRAGQRLSSRCTGAGL